jgi:lysophospholipase L1-like esterase
MGAALYAGGCDDSATKPTPAPDAPKILCPAPLTQPSTDGQPVSVTYPAVTVTGGASPVATSCAPPSPSMFQIGTTSVTCFATDALKRTATCSFPVVVTAPARISATRFIAFGDSMSDGVLGLAPQTLGDAGPAVGYAYKLKALLAARYTAQAAAISMTDEGRPGEWVPMGVTRLPGVLTSDQPEVLLLLEGVNDLNSGGGNAAIPGVKAGLTAMVREARRRGLSVFLATLLPQQPPGQRAQAPASIQPANVEIRAIAASEGAALVDLYAAFDGQTAALIGPDGLHPNERGYQKMAEVFFDAIRGRLEQKTSSLESGTSIPDFRLNLPTASGQRRAR